MHISNKTKLEKLKPLIAGIAKSIRNELRGPEDLSVAQSLVKDHLPCGRYLIYGAGSHTQNIWDAFLSNQNLELVGLINKAVPGQTDFQGFPIYSPDQLPGADLYDYVLLSSPLLEGVFANTLKSKGVDAKKIIAIYNSDLYETLSKPSLQKALDQLPAPDEIDYILIDDATPGHRVIPCEEYRRIFPPERTLRLTFNTPEDNARYPSAATEFQDYRTFSYARSRTLLCLMIERLDPKVIMTLPYTVKKDIDALIMTYFPHIDLYTEWYDVLSLTNSDSPEHDFVLQSSYSDLSFEHLKAIEYGTAHHAKVIISKRETAPTYKVFDSEADNIHLFFPQVKDYAFKESASQNGDIRFIFASHLASYTENVRDYSHNYLPLFKELAKNPAYQFDLFNIRHNSALQDHLFEEYLQHGHENIHYSRCISHADLMEKTLVADYTWLYTQYQEEAYEDTRWIYSNKFGSSLAAGIPVIGDDRNEKIAEYVQLFDAGIVAKFDSTEDLLAKMKDLDPEAHRHGARRLREFLLSHNETKLDLFKELLTC